MAIQLVNTITDDNLVLNGFLSKENSKSVVLYIHGFATDFFSHKFANVIGENLSNKNISFLAAQTRGTMLEEEIITKDGDGKYYGSQLELLEEAYLDIDAWVKLLLAEGFENIILAGHSLGTFKVVRYLFEGKYIDSIKKLILLCPFDKNGQEDVVTYGKWKEYVEIARQKIKDGKGTEYIPKYFEEVKMSYQTFYSWYRETDLNKTFEVFDKSYAFPILNSINIPVCLLVGTEDEFFHRTNPSNPKEAFDIIIKNLKKGSGSLIEGAKHVFRGYEDILAGKFVDFVLND